jgi:hypothetical protein
MSEPEAEAEMLAGRARWMRMIEMRAFNAVADLLDTYERDLLKVSEERATLMQSLRAVLADIRARAPH